MLNSNEIRPDQRYVIYLLEHSYNTAVFNTRNEDSQEICQQCRMLLKVEGQSLVVTTRENISRHALLPMNQWNAYISTLAARTMTSLNWLCSQASADRSIMAKAALSWVALSVHTGRWNMEDSRIHHIWCTGKRVLARDGLSQWLWWPARAVRGRNNRKTRSDWPSECWCAKQIASDAPWLWRMINTMANGFKGLLTFLWLVLAQQDGQFCKHSHL